MESPGTRLKRLRLEKGISLEEVHKKTKVHLNILKAIEEDNLINFSPVYLKGFLNQMGEYKTVETANSPEAEEQKGTSPASPWPSTRRQAVERTAAFERVRAV